ncbi:MAG: zinc ribbon domain-containing protein [Planctomycetota bacterium]
MNCPHCGAVQATTSAFCTTCGKALPSAAPGGPRVVDDSELQTAAGRTLRGAELQKQLKKASGALLAVAILQAVFGGLLFVIGGALLGGEGKLPPAVFVGVFVIAAIFFGLYIWARRSPFPAALAGLVVYLTVHLLDAIADPTTLVRGLIVKIIIILILVRAISAGAKYRALMREQAAEAAARV